MYGKVVLKAVTSDGDDVFVEKLRRPIGPQRSKVHQCSVGGPDIGDADFLAVPSDGAVPRRDRLVGDDDVRWLFTAEEQRSGWPRAARDEIDAAGQGVWDFRVVGCRFGYRELRGRTAARADLFRVENPHRDDERVSMGFQEISPCHALRFRDELGKGEILAR